MDKKKMIAKRVTLIKKARAILEKAKGEGRDLNAEERSNYDTLFDEAAKLKTKIDDANREAELADEERQLEESAGRKSEMERRDKADAKGEKTDEVRTIELRNGETLDLADHPHLRAMVTPEYRADFRRFLASGRATQRLHLDERALQMDSDTAGGFITGPIQFQTTLIKALDNDVFMRQKATMFTVTTGDGLGAPSLDNDPGDPTWTAEIGTGSEDSDMSFGKRELKPHPLARRVKVSKTLLRRSIMPVDQIVRERLRYKFNVVMENNYLNGTGALSPLGVFTASDDGIGTARDVSTGNTATEIRGDGLIEAKFSLKAGYRRKAEWIFHRDAIKQLSKLKDGQGNYMWLPGLRDGEPDKLLDMRFNESEYAPNTFTTGLYVGILGDFSYYWIVDALTLAIQVLLELYAETNQNGYIGRFEGDGMPVLAEAFARVKLA